MDIVNTIFKIVVGKGRIAWQKDKIRHLEQLKDYYEMINKLDNPDQFEKVIQEEYTKLARLEEKQMK